MNNRNKITFKIVLLTVDAWSQRSCRASHSSHRAPAGRSRHTRGPGSLWPAWFRSHSWISLLFGTYPCMWTFVRVYFFFPGYEIALLSGNTDHKEYFFLFSFFFFLKKQPNVFPIWSTLLFTLLCGRWNTEMLQRNTEGSRSGRPVTEAKRREWTDAPFRKRFCLTRR